MPTMNSKDIREKQAGKLFHNWHNYGHWGMFEDDEENNDDTRNIIALYAAEHHGQAFLLRRDGFGSMTSKPFDPKEHIFNHSYIYITGDGNVAAALCEAHNGPVEEMYQKLSDLEGEDYIYLIWN